MSLLVFNLVAPLSTKKKPSGPICMAKRECLAYFGLSLVPIRPYFGHSGSSKWPKLVCLDVFIDVPTLFRPFQLKVGPRAYLGGQKAIFSQFWLLFGRRRTIFRTFWMWQMVQTDQPGCPYWCSNLFLSCTTQNMPSGLICAAKRLILAYFGPFLAPKGPYLGHSGSGKCAKLINLDVLS